MSPYARFIFYWINLAFFDCFCPLASLSDFFPIFNKIENPAGAPLTAPAWRRHPATDEAAFRSGGERHRRPPGPREDIGGPGTGTRAHSIPQWPRAGKLVFHDGHELDLRRYMATMPGCRCTGPARLFPRHQSQFSSAQDSNDAWPISSI